MIGATLLSDLFVQVIVGTRADQNRVILEIWNLKSTLKNFRPESYKYTPKKISAKNIDVWGACNFRFLVKIGISKVLLVLLISEMYRLIGFF